MSGAFKIEYDNANRAGVADTAFARRAAVKMLDLAKREIGRMARGDQRPHNWRVLKDGQVIFKASDEEARLLR